MTDSFYARAFTPTAVKTGNYTATAGDFVPCDTTSGGFTVTLPAAPADLSVVGVKHVIQGGSNTVTVACAGSDALNKTGGATSGTLTLLAQGMLLQYRASGAIWYVTADDLALPQLDSRYVAQSTLPLPVSSGGTGQASQAAALTALAGTQASGKVLRSDGTNTALANIQAGDVPTLNQSTTGTAAGLSSALAIATGGTGDTGTLLTGLPSLASDNGYIAQNFDPATAPVNASTGMVNYAAGAVFLSRCDLRTAVAPGKKMYFWWVQPTGGSPANCFLAAFTSAGVQLAVSGNLTAVASGFQSLTLPALSAGAVYGAVLVGTQGGTQAGGCMYSNGAISAASSTFAAGNGLGTSSYRCSRQGSGLSAMPGSLAMASNVVAIPYFWVAIGA